MAIGADASISFSEICRTARDVEKSLITPKPNQISGELHPPEAGSIFPKEYDEYTYLLLLSEAHKVERKLFTSAYQGSLTGTGQPGAAPPKFDERQIELASRQLSDYPLSNQPAAKKEEQGAFSRLSNLKNPFGKKTAGQIAPPSRTAQIAQAVSQEEEIPSEVLMARKERMARQEMEAPPEPEKEGEDVAVLSEEKEVPAPLEEEPGEEAFESPIPKKQPASGKEEILEAPPARQQSGAAASQIAASSKISPRLRAIIEEKLKREEEKERQELEAEAAKPKMAPVEKEETAAAEEPPPNEEAEEKMPAMSARERLLRKLKSAKAREAPSAPVEKEEDETEDGKEESLSEGEFDKGGETGPEEKEKEKPRAVPEGKPPVSSASSPFQAKGGLQIKQIYPEDVGKKEEEEKSEPTADFADKQAPAEKEKEEPQSSEEMVSAPDDQDSDERMARIQRIIDELSPEKLKAQVEQPQKQKKAPEPVEKESDDEQEEKIELSVSKAIPKKGKVPPKAAAKEAAKGAKGKVAPARQLPGKKRIIPEELPVQKKPAAQLQRKMQAQKDEPGRTVPVQMKAPPPPEEGEATQEAAEPTPAAKPSARVQASPRSPIPSPGARILPQKSSAAFAAQTSGAKPRIFPGGVKQSTPKTYIPPARPRAIEKPEETEEEPEEKEIPIPAPAIAQKRQPMVPPAKITPVAPKEEEEEPAEEEQAQGGKADGEKPRQAVPVAAKPIIAKKAGPPQTQEEKVLTAKPKKLVLQESVEETPSIEQLKERSHIKELGEKFVRMTSHDIAGEAKLPSEKEGSDLEVPQPPSDEAPPKPADYAQAKDNLRRKAEQENIAENAKKESEEMLENYAKDNLTWLYEIYKMGGIAREAFLQKVQEKIDEEKGAGEIEKMETGPDNPALVSLDKQLGEKKKKWPF